MKDGRHGATVKWVDYGSVGQSQVRDLLTHFASCPLPAELLVGRDPIHSPIILQEMILPRHERHYWTWQQPNRLPRLDLSITLMWLHSVTEWIMWQLFAHLKYGQKRKGEWDTCCKVAHCQYPCPQLHHSHVHEILKLIEVFTELSNIFLDFFFLVFIQVLPKKTTKRETYLFGA